MGEVTLSQFLNLLNNGAVLAMLAFIYKIAMILYQTVVQTKENTKDIGKIKEHLDLGAA